MTLEELIAQVSGFDGLPHPDKIRCFSWYIHTERGLESFDNAAIRDCYHQLHLTPPNLSVYLARMVSKKPPDLLRAKRGYKLAGPIRRTFDNKFGRAGSVVVAALLSDLPGKIPNLPEQAFLLEALDCYRVKAFRAAIVMSWVLTFAHLSDWIVSDASRLAAFNGAMAARFPSKKALSIQGVDDLTELKEFETIEIARTAKLLSKNVSDILRDKLKRRNMAAHPSRVQITQAQTDDVITDLINNVVLRLA
jgi:hypothetical protein